MSSIVPAWPLKLTISPRSTQTESVTAADHSNVQRTLADYVAIIRRHKWVAILPLLLVPIVAYGYSSRQPIVYAASAEVLLSRQDLGSSLSGATNADIFTDADRFAQTQAALARVPDVARRAVARSGVKAISPGQLLANSSVAPRGNADLLQFTVQNADPKVAARLASAYAAAYTEFRLKLDTAALANARRDLQRTIAALERRGAADTPLYRSLAEKVQELRTRELLQTRAEVVRTADVGGRIAPTPRRDGMLGVAFGLLLGLAAVFLWEALDRRVRDEDEIHRALKIPLLARLPAPRSERLAMIDDPSDVDAEAVRRLRSSIEFANLDVKAKVIMVTSSVSQEGKTTTISNLAVALARAGHRVVLVDLDLRKPMVGKYFAIEFRQGLADVAVGRIELERALVPVRLEARGQMSYARALSATMEGMLYVLPAGFLPASPGELVGTEAVANILDQLRASFDFVLVDAPPLLTVSDAATLSTRVDAVLVAVRLGLVNRPMLRDLARELDASPAAKLGFILTGADATELYAFGGYAHRAKDDSVSRPRQEPTPELDETIPVVAERGSPPFAD